MRIVHAVNELVDNGNGIVNVAVDLACSQAADGHEVTVVSRGGEFVSLVERFGASHRRASLRLSAAEAIASRRELTDAIDAADPDIVHSHTLTPAALAYSIRCEQRMRRRAPRYRLVTTVHNEYQRGAFLMGCSDLTVSVSAAVDAAMGKRGIASARRRVVRNGTIGSPRRRPAEAVAPAVMGERSILALGAVSHRKGSDVAIAAFERVAHRYPDLSLWFVGNPDWAELVAETKNKWFHERVHFVGLDREPAKYLNSATMMVLPSRRDPFPLVLLEAREVGLPIVASEIDGIPEALDGGESGLLFPVGDAERLAGSIERLLESASLRGELARRARSGADRFSVGRMKDEYVDHYLEQLAFRTV